MNYLVMNSVAVKTLFISALLLGWAVQAKELKVVVDADADPEYLERTRGKEFQTYRFTQGKYFGGDKRDNSLRRMEFEDILRSVATGLQENQFYPTKIKESCDLLIMVSWGTTQLDIDWMDLMGTTDLGGGDSGGDFGGDAGGEDDFGGEDTSAFSGGSDLSYFGSSGSELQRNIRLLGYDQGLSKDTPRIERERYWQDLQDERYFIVLNAFDYQHYLEHGQLKQVWSTRYSTRNRGTNFLTALDVLNTAAAGAFGVNLDTLEVRKVNTDSDISFGEIEVIAITNDTGEE